MKLLNMMLGRCCLLCHRLSVLFNYCSSIKTSRRSKGCAHLANLFPVHQKWLH